MPYAVPGGPKVLAMNITGGNDTFYKSYTFPSTVYYPVSPSRPLHDSVLF